MHSSPVAPHVAWSNRQGITRAAGPPTGTSDLTLCQPPAVLHTHKLIPTSGPWHLLFLPSPQGSHHTPAPFPFSFSIPHSAP